jgi:hypothetical protein
MDLFSNPMVNNALKSMTSEQLEKYKKIGEHLYGNINFEDSKILNNMLIPTEEAVAYVEEGIKSGISPSDLDENEVILLTNTYGDKWYLRYGFKEEEVPEAGLSLGAKESIEKLIQAKINQEEMNNN